MKLVELRYSGREPITIFDSPQDKGFTVEPGGSAQFSETTALDLMRDGPETWARVVHEAAQVTHYEPQGG